MKRTFIKIATVTTALILCVTLLSSCGILNLLLPQLFNNSAINLGPQDFTTVEYTRPDFEEIHTQFDVFLAKLNQGASELTLTFELSEAYSLFNDAQTMYNVADINYYNDVNDSLAKEESEYCAEEFAKLQIKLTEVYCAIVDSGYESVLLPTWTEDDLANLEIEKKLYDNEYVEIQADIAKIQNDYMQIPSEIKVVHGGKSYTIDEIVDMMQEGQLTDAEYSKHVDSFYAQYANAATPLDLQLVDRNNRIAEKAGYETYAEYAYKHVYYRDYLPSDITKKVYKQVREYIIDCY